MRSARRLFLVAFVGLVVGCGGSAGPSDSGASGAPGSSAARPAGSPAAGTVVLQDAAADLKDETGAAAKPRPEIDVKTVTASIAGGSLVVDLVVAGNIPAKSSSKKVELSYATTIETDGSGRSDYWLLLTNQKDGTWRAELDDWTVSKTYAGKAYPGSYKLTKNVLRMTVKLKALHAPSRIRLAVLTQATDQTSGDVVIGQDVAPEGEPYQPTDQWLTLKTV